eukprot:12880194-Prorocentrum_lima.AAC.1
MDPLPPMDPPPTNEQEQQWVPPGMPPDSDEKDANRLPPVPIEPDDKGPSQGNEGAAAARRSAASSSQQWL